MKPLVVLFLIALVAGTARAEVTLTGDTSRPSVSTFAVGEPVTLTFQAKGLNAGQKLTLAIDIEDEHAATQRHQDLPVVADAAGNWTGTLAAPHLRQGFYRVRATLSNGVTLAALGSRKAGSLTYAVVPDPARRPLYDETDARFGMQGGFSSQTSATLPLLGIRWTLGGGNWAEAEPDHAGQFAEKRAAAKARGERFPASSDIEAALFGGRPWTVYSLPSLYFPPKWAAAPDTQGTGTAALRPEAEAAWAEYCRQYAQAFTENYPTRKQHLYQITWEPVYPWGYKGTGAQLVRIYEIAFQALHHADLKAEVFGPTGSNLDTDWTGRLLSAGLARYLDGYSVHPYFSIQPEAAGMAGTVRAVQELLHQAMGHVLPQIGTEEGFATGEDPAKELDQARGLMRQNLILLGEGYQFNFAFYITDYAGEPGYGYYYNLDPDRRFGADKVSPKAVAPAYAAQSFLLDGTHSAGTIDWLGPTTSGYIFERKDRVTLALWDWGDTPRKVTLPVGPQPIIVYDWMGNPKSVQAPGGSLTLTLGPEPVYVAGVSPRLWGSRARKPLRLAAGRLISSPGATAIVTATVAPDQPLRGTVTLKTDKALGQSLMSQTVTAAPGRIRQVRFTLKLPATLPQGSYPIEMLLRDEVGIVAANGALIEVQPPATIETVAPVFPAGAAGLTVTLRETQGQKLHGSVQVRLMGVPDTTQAGAFTLAPRKTVPVTVSLPHLELAAGRRVQAAVRVKTAGGYNFTQTFPVDFLTAPQVATPPTMDGSLSQWHAIPPVSLRGRDSVVRSPQYYRGDTDLSTDLRYAWDARNLYFAADVTDDTFLQENTGFQTWKGDAIQLGFDLDFGKEQKTTGNLLADQGSRHRYSEISLALTKRGPEAYRTITFDSDKFPVANLPPTALHVSVIRRGTHTIYQAAIPWQTLGLTGAPKMGDTLGLAVAVNDMDNAAQLDPHAVGLFSGVAGAKDPAQFGSLTLSAAPATALSDTAPRLEYAGVLGQSQPIGQMPLPFIGAAGVALDSHGTLWTGGGQTLYGFTKQGGALTCTVRIPTPAPISPSLGIRGDGQSIYFGGTDDKVYTQDSSGQPHAICILPDKTSSFAVAPAGPTHGFAARGKLFALAGDVVSAFGADGTPLGKVLTLTRPAGADWWYCSLGIEPGTGDLLVGSYYPDLKVYRFNAQGQPVTRDGWPRSVFAQQIVTVNHLAWALKAGGGAQALPGSQTTAAPVMEPDWTSDIYGMAAKPGEGYWIASSQGLSRFGPEGKATGQRLGGLDGLGLLAVAPDGTVIASTENGQRMLRLALDGGPDSTLTGNSNEPWRVGGGWTDHAAGVCTDGGTFLVLDETAKQIWRFDPAHTAWGETPWVKVPGPVLTKPRALALGGDRAFILDSGRLLEADRTNLTTMRTVALPDMSMDTVTQIAADDEGTLYLADTTRVTAYARNDDGSYRRLWQSAVPFGHITGLAADEHGALVSDADVRTLTLLAWETGAASATLTAKDIPGGWQPGVVSAQGGWYVVYDDLGKRIVLVR